MSLLHPQMHAAMPDYSDVEQSTEVIQGVDGNEVTLYIHRPLKSTRSDAVQSTPTVAGWSF